MYLILRRCEYISTSLHHSAMSTHLSLEILWHMQLMIVRMSACPVRVPGRKIKGYNPVQFFASNGGAGGGPFPRLHVCACWGGKWGGASLLLRPRVCALGTKRIGRVADY